MSYRIALAFYLFSALATDVEAQTHGMTSAPADDPAAARSDNAPTTSTDKAPFPLPPDTPFGAPPKAVSQLSMEQPEVGDYWTIETHNGITGVLEDIHTVTVTAVTASEIGIRTETVGRSGFRSEIYDRDWNLKNGSGKEYPLGDGIGIKPPLKVGNTWNIPATHSGPLTIAGSAKVLAEETVTTRAGSFDAFKIETVIHMYIPNVTTQSGDVIFTSWYAPSIDHWVKRTAKVSHNGNVSEEKSAELVVYGRR
jgi:hypothetical protein